MIRSDNIAAYGINENNITVFEFYPISKEHIAFWIFGHIVFKYTFFNGCLGVCCNRFAFCGFFINFSFNERRVVKTLLCENFARAIINRYLLLPGL